MRLRLRVLYLMTSHICQVAAVMVASTALGFAQQPEDFYVSPAVVTQGECYDAWVTPISPRGCIWTFSTAFNGGPWRPSTTGR